MATGFHGAHVIIGTIFLIVCLVRAQAGQFTPQAAPRLRVRRLVLAFRRRRLAVPVLLHLCLGFVGRGDRRRGRRLTAGWRRARRRGCWPRPFVWPALRDRGYDRASPRRRSRELPQIEVEARRLRWRQRQLGADDPPRGHMVPRPVDRLNRGERAAAKAEHREGSRQRIAADDPLIDAVREACDLQLQIALVAPEPWQRRIGLRLCRPGGARPPAPDRRRSGPIRGVRRSRPAGSERCAQSPTAEIERAGRLEQLVDDDPIIAGEAGLAREPVFRKDADSDDGEIGRQRLASRLVRRSAPRRSRHGAPRPRRPAGSSRRTPHVRHGRRRKPRPTARGPSAAGDLDDRHLAPEARRGRGDLETDEARADHHDALRRSEALAQAPRSSRSRRTRTPSRPTPAIRAAAAARPSPARGGHSRGSRPCRARRAGRAGRCAEPPRRAAGRCGCRRRIAPRAAAGRRAPSRL